ncbi:MAG: MCP four helix bundle domain-containing protein, partial [Acetobacteraceae bacterium]|nr:MCP four helix bundle domain-containing protein [Acetobacteraceae bacterium]
WVRANVTPLVENGTVTGYVSIRSKPSREEVATADSAYAAMRAGGTGMGLRDGEIIRTGWRARLQEFAASVSGRMVTACGTGLLGIAVVGALGLSGMAASNEALRSAHEDHARPAQQLARIQDLMYTGQIEASLIPGDRVNGVATAGRVAATRAIVAEIGSLLPSMQAALRGEEERRLGERFAAAREVYLRDGLMPMLALAESGSVEAMRSQLRDRLLPLFMAANALNRELSERQAQAATVLRATAETDFTRRLWSLAAVMAATLAGMAGLAWFAWRGIARPMQTLRAEMERIGRGELRGRIATPTAREFRPVFAMLRALRARLGYTDQERTELDRRAGEARKLAVSEMAGRVETESRAAVAGVEPRTKALTPGTQAVAAAAAPLGENATAAAQAADRTQANSQSVAAATEELSASIREIASQTARAAEVVGRAVAGGEAAQATIGTLANAASRVTDVVRLISDVAARTNLLALNATIEAARAGEAGKGFAVVAGEVKALATQTARATAEIGNQLGEIQNATEAAVASVGAMGRAVAEISETAGAIAAAVEQQGAATREIARNLAANGAEVRDMATRIEAVATDAGQAGVEAARLRDEAATVNDTVTQLREGLVAIIRTSMAEADRRAEPRFTVNEPCILRSGGRASEGTLRDISAHGALVSGAGALGAAAEGVLELPRSRVSLRFRLRDAGRHGLHLELP